VEIVVADFGTGNLRSVVKALEHVAPRARIRLSHDPEAFGSADRIVLPGQGAIGTWMAALSNARREALAGAFRDKPILGICVGLQALFERSDEDGGTPGLGVLRGRVQRFPSGREPDGTPLKIPHMGWNNVVQTHAHPLWMGIPDASRFYFVHSYYAAAEDREQCVGESTYGLRFTAAVALGTLFAVQFHPEKSQQVGLRLLTNFVRWDGAV